MPTTTPTAGYNTRRNNSLNAENATVASGAQNGKSADMAFNQKKRNAASGLATPQSLPGNKAAAPPRLMTAAGMLSRSTLYAEKPSDEAGVVVHQQPNSPVSFKTLHQGDDTYLQWASAAHFDGRFVVPADKLPRNVKVDADNARTVHLVKCDMDREAAASREQRRVQASSASFIMGQNRYAESSFSGSETHPLKRDDSEFTLNSQGSFV